MIEAIRRSVLIIVVLLLCACSNRQAIEELKNGFRDPPKTARPHVWWHWINGNISTNGITSDLEAMAVAGIGGGFNI